MNLLYEINNIMSIIQRIGEELNKTGIPPGTNPARTWLIQKVKKLNPTTKDRMELIRQRELQKSKAIVGRMYFFFYNPKTKDTLPYWDKFPLVIPLQRYSEGFLGLNLHYITPRDRLILLKQLGTLLSNNSTDEQTRLRISYPILSSMHNAFRSKPCIKQYLGKHITSRIIEIPVNEWDIAAALPLQQFKSDDIISSQEIWEDSKRKY